MPRKERADSFLFEPGALKRDPAVLAMSPAARGGYLMLLCEAWDMPEPGVIEPATDQVLANLAMLDAQTWRRVKREVASAFDTESRPGAWIQKRMVITHGEQDRFIERQRAAGKASVAARKNGSVRTETERASNDPRTVLGGSV